MEEKAAGWWVRVRRRCGEEVDSGVIARTHLRLDLVLDECQVVPGDDRDGQPDEDAGDQDCQARADDTDEPARAQLHRGALLRSQ